MNHIVHIEFYGLPGCGKSTISHQTARRLRQNGWTVYEPSYDMDHGSNRTLRKVRKLWITLRFCLIHGGDCRRALALVGGCTSRRQSLRHLLNIVPKLAVYRRSHQSKGADLYIWDEGLTQSAVSLAMDTRKSADQIEEQLRSLAGSGRVQKIYLKTDVRTALERMNARADNDSRVEKESAPLKKQELMRRFEACCNQIREGSWQSENESLSPQALTEEIADWLMKRLNESV